MKLRSRDGRLGKSEMDMWGECVCKVKFAPVGLDVGQKVGMIVVFVVCGDPPMVLCSEEMG